MGIYCGASLSAIMLLKQDYSYVHQVIIKLSMIVIVTQLLTLSC